MAFYDAELLRKIDLSQKKFQGYIIDPIRESISGDDVDECRKNDNLFDEYFELHPKFSTDHPELYKEFKELHMQTRWVAMPVIKDEKVIDCFANHINIGWELANKYDYSKFYDNPKPFQQNEYVIFEKLRSHLDLLITNKERDELKNKILDELTQNEELITSHDLVSDQKKLKPTLARWMEIYFEAVGTGEVNKLKIAQFYTENSNFQKCTAQEQAKLKVLFKIYEKMKLSSWQIQGNEVEVPYEREGEFGKYIYGELEKYPKEEVESFNKFIKDNEQLLTAHKLIDQKFYTGQRIEKGLKEKLNQNKDNKKDMNVISKYKPTDEPKSVVQDMFNETDEQEVDMHAEPSGLKKMDVTYEEILKYIKQRFSLIFNDEALEKRFDNLVVSYLKGIRDAIEFKNTLTNKKESGGMDYNVGMAADILSAIDENISGKQINMPVKKADFSAPDKQKPSLSMQQAQGLMAKAKKAAAKNELHSNTNQPPQVKPVVVAKKTADPIAIPQVRRLQSNKPIVHDIKIPQHDARLVGPVDELQNLNLVKFRRLASNAVEATERIKEKIDLLEEKSLVEKAKGVVAYKNSELNKIYLKIGNTSINEGKSVDEVIDSMNQKGEKILTKEEFDAVADLNKKLRF